MTDRHFPSIAALLDDGVRRFADLPSHVVGPSGETSVSLGELWGDAGALAADLVRLGAQPGDVIAFQIPTWREGAVAFYAALSLGAVALPLVYVYGTSEIEWILADAKASFFMIAPASDRAVAEERAATACGVPSIKSVLCIEREGTGISWSVVGAGAGDLGPGGLASRPDCSLLLYTSGTESMPKGVRHTTGSILAEVLGQRPCGHSITPDEVVMFTGPLGHVGSVMYLLYPFAHGLPVVYLDRWSAEAAAEAIARRSVTFTHGPPTVVQRLLDQMEPDLHRYRSLRRVRVGGAEISPDMIARLEDEFGLIGFRTYGSTEHPTTASGTEDDSVEKRATTDGRPLPGNELRIVGPGGVDVEAGDEGEIWTRGGELFAGYRNPELDAVSRVDGWYRTGDLGVVDPEGYLVVTGRIKDVIVRGGENIPARRVVDTLLAHDAIREAAVVAAKDPDLGERVFAFVVTDGERDVSIDELRAHFAAQKISRHYLPEGIERVDALPFNAMGKVRRDVLRTRASELWAASTSPSGAEPARTTKPDPTTKEVSEHASR